MRCREKRARTVHGASVFCLSTTLFTAPHGLAERLRHVTVKIPIG